MNFENENVVLHLAEQTNQIHCATNIKTNNISCIRSKGVVL